MPPRARDEALLEGTDDLDISHEALLRRWTTLRKWVTQEAEDADLFKRLATRANDAEEAGFLRGAELALFLNWYGTFAPTEACAER